MISVYVEEARDAAAVRRPALWARAAELAAAFEQTQPPNGWASVVRYQAAMAAVTRAELSVLPAEMGLTGAAAAAAALSDLRLAVKELADLEQQIDDQFGWQARNAAPQK